jgi:NAD(P)-dependent dehydrogenase (short-subunit alcohol dehydrogenase family)
MKLKNKVALITGAGRGLGRASAVAMAREGAALALISRTAAELDETALLVEKAGGSAIALPLDISDEKALREAVDKAGTSLGGIDILMNNAAVVGPVAPLHEVDPDEWRYTLAVNIDGARQACQEAVPHMIRAGGGRIINVTSGMAEISMPLFGAYSASKAALNNMSRIMAEELRGYGIQVNGLDPGVMDTHMQTEIRDMGPPILGRALYEQFLSFKQEGHLKQPEEVARLAVFLSSDDSVGVSGEIGGEEEFRDYGYGLSED